MALLSGCASAELVVDVRSDFAAGLEVDRVVLEVDGRVRTEVEIQTSYDLVERGVRLPSVSVDPGVHTFTVTLLRAGVATAVGTQSGRYAVNGNSLVEVWVVRGCARLTCPPAGMPTLTSCDRGQCVEPECIASTCTPAECTTETDCSSVGLSPCAEVTCIDGRCLGLANNSRCEPSQVCDPERGCLDQGFLDAGVPPDAGMDAPIVGADVPDAWVDPGLDAPLPDVPSGSDVPELADVPVTPDTGLDAPLPGPPYVLYFLRPGSTAWESVTTTGAAPTEAVIAAFSSRDNGGIVALTSSAAHLLTVPGHVWTTALPRSVAFPDLEGTTLYEITEMTGVDDTRLFAFTSTERIDMRWIPASGTETLNARVPRVALEPYWYTPVSPPWGEILAVFGRRADAENWVTETPGYGCPPVTGPHFTFFSWPARGSPLSVSVLDGNGTAGCFVFVSQMPSGSYPPLMYAGTFDLGLVEAVTDYDGLYAFTRP